MFCLNLWLKFVWLTDIRSPGEWGSPQVGLDRDGGSAVVQARDQGAGVGRLCGADGGHEQGANAAAREWSLPRLQQVPGNEPRAHSRVRTQERSPRGEQGRVVHVAQAIRDPSLWSGTNRRAREAAEGGRGGGGWFKNSHRRTSVCHSVAGVRVRQLSQVLLPDRSAGGDSVKVWNRTPLWRIWAARCARGGTGYAETRASFSGNVRQWNGPLQPRGIFLLPGVQFLPSRIQSVWGILIWKVALQTLDGFCA